MNIFVRQYCEQIILCNIIINFIGIKITIITIICATQITGVAGNVCAHKNLISLKPYDEMFCCIMKEINVCLEKHMV